MIQVNIAAITLAGILTAQSASASTIPCWGQAQSDNLKHPSNSWATNLLTDHIVDGCPHFCVQYTGEIDGTNYTTGGCEGQLVGQEALLSLKCNYDGQRIEIVAPFMGQGDPLPLTAYCCTTPLCNGCSHGLSKTNAYDAALRHSDTGEHFQPGDTCDVDTCDRLHARIAALEKVIADHEESEDEVYECNVRPPPQFAGVLKKVASKECPVPKLDESFTCQFQDLGWYGNYGKLGVEFPPGAWPPEEKRVPRITVFASEDHHLEAESDAHEHSEIAGVMIDFQPSPVTFLKPVTLILPVYELDTELHRGRAFSAAMFDTKTMKWIMKPVSPGKPTVVNGSVQGETSSFSLYAAISYPEDGAPCGTACMASILGGVLGLICLCARFCCFAKEAKTPEELERMDLMYYYYHVWHDETKRKADQIQRASDKVARLRGSFLPSKRASLPPGRTLRPCRGGGRQPKTITSTVAIGHAPMRERETKGVLLSALGAQAGGGAGAGAGSRDGGWQGMGTREVETETVRITRLGAGASAVSQETAKQIVAASRELDGLFRELSMRAGE